MSFLHELELSIKILFLIGLCPFHVKKNSNQKRSTIQLECLWYHLAYTAILLISITIISSFVCSHSIAEKIDENSLFYGLLLKISLAIYMSSLIIGYFLSLALSLSKRSVHIILLNQLQKYYCNNNIINKNYGKNFLSTIFIVFSYFICHILSVYIWSEGHTSDDLYSIVIMVVLAIVSAFMITILLQSMNYLRFLSKVIIDHIAWINKQFNGCCAFDLNFVKKVYINTISELNDDLIVYRQYAGDQLIVIMIECFVILTVNTFLVFLSLRQDGLHITALYFIAVYMLPIYVKVVMLIGTLDQFGDQVCLF